MDYKILHFPIFTIYVCTYTLLSLFDPLIFYKMSNCILPSKNSSGLFHFLVRLLFHLIKLLLFPFNYSATVIYLVNIFARCLLIHTIALYSFEETCIDLIVIFIILGLPVL